MSYRVFTVQSGTVSDGANVDKMTLSGAGVTIDAIVVGEEGRGRSRGVLPVQGVPAEGPADEYGRRPERVVWAADIGLTKSGKPKLVVGQTTTSDKAIVVFRTPIGFRGGNSHTGDRRPEWDAWEKISQAAFAKCQEAAASDGLDEYGRAARAFSAHEEWVRANHAPEKFLLFPGEIIAEGTIAQGDAGRAGSGDQIVALMPHGVVFRTGYSGRLYGKPSAHYYVFDGEKILAATREEREASDIF